MFVQLALALKNRVCPERFQDRGWPLSSTPRLVRLCIRLLTLGTLWDVLSVSGSQTVVRVVREGFLSGTVVRS